MAIQQRMAGLLFMAVAALGNAAEPADQDIRAAMIDISKYESQFSGNQQPSKLTINRTLKLLKIPKQRLDASSNKSHASWQEANQRYNNLVAHLNTLLSPQATTTAAPTPTRQPQPQTRPAQTQSAQMISQQRVRVTKLKRDIASAIQTIDQAGVKPFQDPAYVQKLEAAAQRYQQNLAKYDAFKSDPDVIAAATELQTFNNMLAFGKQHAAKEVAELGDVQSELRQMDQRMKRGIGVEAPSSPYVAQDITRWFAAVRSYNETTAADLKRLQEIAQRASLPNNPGTVEQGAPYDSQDVSRISRWMQDRQGGAQKTIQQIGLNMNAQAGHSDSTLAFYENLDPNDEHTQANMLLSEDAESSAKEALAKEVTFAQAAIAYYQAVGGDGLQASQALLQRAQQAQQLFSDKRATALQVVRMPKAASTDAELIAIARKTLANPDYEVGEILRLVINSDKVSRESESSEIDIDDVDVSLSGKVTMSGTETTTRYEWEQYQVTTAEPVGSKTFMFYNTLKFFTKGGTTTPLNRWLLSGRLKGKEILRENVNKD